MATLLVATSGGHLEELWELRRRMRPMDDDVLWVTWDTAQSRALLAGEQRVFAPPARPRDAGAALRTLRLARHVIALARWSQVVSTGSSVAVPFLSLARAQGIPCHFVESAARVAEPSLTGRIFERTPGIHRYAPYPWWNRPGWAYRGSVLDGFAAAPAERPALRRVVVTVGGSQYSSRCMLTSLQAALPPGCDVFWQTGATDIRGMGLEAVARSYVGHTELAQRMAEADLVVSHAGVGSALTAMRAGRLPLLVPRRAARGEHVDDHQVQIAVELERRGLAVACEAGALAPAELWKAASGRVTAADAGEYLLDSPPVRRVPAAPRATA